MSRLRSGNYRLEPGSKVFELAQHLLRLFRTLDSTFAPTLSSNSKNCYGISGLNLTSAVLTFHSSNYVLIENITTTPAVPEPATWAMMILGMGAIGFAMRRRKNVNMTVRFA